MLQRAMRHLRILVVDDSPTFLRTLCSFFEDDPNIQIVGTAQGADEAFATIAELQPDLVLMDLQMPGMSGLEATEVLHGRFPAIPVVMLTAHDIPGLRQACKKCGAYEFAAKGRLSVELPPILTRLRASLDN